MTTVSAAQNGMWSELKSQYGDAEAYEARQNRFYAVREEVVAATGKLIEDRANEPVQLFYDLVRQLGERRHQLAVEAGSPNPEYFGARHHELALGNLSYTPFIGASGRVGQRALRDISRAIHSMDHTKEEFIQTAKKTSETINGRVYQMTCEILSSEQLQKMFGPIAKDNVTEIDREYYFAQQEEKKLETAPSDHQDQSRTYRWQKIFKEKFPEDYQRVKKAEIIRTMSERFPSPRRIHDAFHENFGNLKSDWIWITTREEMGGKLVATKQLVTWVYRNYKEDPCERMLLEDCRPPVYAIHQDLFLHEISLNECARLFQQILALDRTVPAEQLKAKVAELRYLFAQTAPYHRGSATVGEWLEGAIYRTFGLACTYRPECPKDDIDMAALRSLTFSSFLRDYDRLVELTPIGS